MQVQSAISKRECSADSDRRRPGRFQLWACTFQKKTTAFNCVIYSSADVYANSFRVTKNPVVGNKEDPKGLVSFNFQVHSYAWQHMQGSISDATYMTRSILTQV